MAAQERSHDNAGGGSPTLIYPASRAFAVTPHDTNEVEVITRGLFVGVAGDVKVKTQGGDTITFKNLVAGLFHPIRVKQVFLTGTTATDIIGVY